MEAKKQKLHKQANRSRRRKVRLDSGSEVLSRPEVNAAVWRDFGVETTSQVRLNRQLSEIRVYAAGFYLLGEGATDGI